MEERSSAGGSSASVTEQVSWNLAQSITMQLANLLQKGSTHFLNGNLVACFYTFKEIKILIFADLKENERERLNDLEEKFYKTSACFQIEYLRTRIAPEFYKKLKNSDSISRHEANKVIEKYRESIISLLANYGYLIGKKEDTGRMF